MDNLDNIEKAFNDRINEIRNIQLNSLVEAQLECVYLINQYLYIQMLISDNSKRILETIDNLSDNLNK